MAAVRSLRHRALLSDSLTFPHSHFSHQNLQDCLFDFKKELKTGRLLFVIFGPKEQLKKLRAPPSALKTVHSCARLPLNVGVPKIPQAGNSSFSDEF